MTGTILIAENDVGLGQALQRCLGIRGYDVTVARNALECIDRLRTMVPSVLVLDPGILWGGAAGVLEWLLQEKPMSVPKIAIVHDDRSASMPQTLIEPFIHSCLPRPHDLKDLLPFVNEIERLAGSPSAYQPELASTHEK